jgi:hypothetical protein
VRPLFTIHAGEFVVGDFIEAHYPGVSVWVPTRDTGIDLLITDSKNQRTVSLQVKFSRRSESGSNDFVVIKPSELLARLDRIHGEAKTIHCYLWVTKKRCWEARGLTQAEELEIAEGRYTNEVRDFSRYLNVWTPIEALNSCC